jgi:CyaY protein
MNESDFNRLAEQTLNAIEEAVEESGADIDYDTVSDILTLEFDNGSQVIINKQGPARQLWVAARSGGFHFDYDVAGQVWVRDNQSKEELFACLSRCCSEQAGESVNLSG